MFQGVCNLYSDNVFLGDICHGKIFWTQTSTKPSKLESGMQSMLTKVTWSNEVLTFIQTTFVRETFVLVKIFCTKVYYWKFFLLNQKFLDQIHWDKLLLDLFVLNQHVLLFFLTTKFFVWPTYFWSKICLIKFVYIWTLVCQTFFGNISFGANFCLTIFLIYSICLTFFWDQHFWGEEIFWD